MPIAGTFRNLRVFVSAQTGAGNTYDYMFRVNGADSALTCQLTNGVTLVNDLTHEVHVEVGDKVCLETTPASTPNTNRSSISMGFVPD